MHHHHPDLLHRHTLIPDRLLTFLVAFSTLVLRPSFSQSLSLQSHLSVAEAYLPEFDHSMSVSHWWWQTKPAQLAFGHTTTVILTCMLSEFYFQNSLTL